MWIEGHFCGSELICGFAFVAIMPGGDTGTPWLFAA